MNGGITGTRQVVRDEKTFERRHWARSLGCTSMARFRSLFTDPYPSLMFPAVTAAEIRKGCDEQASWIMAAAYPDCFTFKPGAKARLPIWAVIERLAEREGVW